MQEQENELELQPASDTTTSTIVDTPEQTVNPEQDPEAVVYHPLLMLEGDAFTFTPGEMDTNFYEALYGLSMKLDVIRQAVQDEELHHLTNYLHTFLMACAYKCQQEGLISKPKFKDWNEKVKEIATKLKEAEPQIITE